MLQLLVDGPIPVKSVNLDLQADVRQINTYIAVIDQDDWVV